MTKWLNISLSVGSSILLAVTVLGVLDSMQMRKEREIITESLLMIQNNNSEEGMHKCFTETRYDNSKLLCFVTDLDIKLRNYDLPTREYCESMPKIKKQPYRIILKNLFKSESGKLAEKEDEKIIMDTCLANSFEDYDS